MAMKLIRTQAGDGVFVNLIKDDRFKHDRIAVNFILPLARETATGYALLPFLMQRGYAGCSDFTAFARKLDELYGATVAGKVSKAGNYQIITLTIPLNLVNSRSGRAIMALRDNRIAAESVGIGATKYKLMAFVTSAALAGAAGALYGYGSREELEPFHPVFLAESCAALADALVNA